MDSKGWCRGDGRGGRCCQSPVDGNVEDGVGGTVAEVSNGDGQRLGMSRHLLRRCLMVVGVVADEERRWTRVDGVEEGREWVMVAEVDAVGGVVDGGGRGVVETVTDVPDVLELLALDETALAV